MAVLSIRKCSLPHRRNLYAHVSVINIHNNNKKFLEELIAYFLFISNGPHRKRKKLGGDTKTHRQQCDLISLLLFFAK
jgi:hypothetical protein